MPKPKPVFFTFIVLILITAGVYVYSLIIKSAFMGGILSPAITGISGCALLYAFIRSDRERKENLSLLLYALGCFFWMLSDIAWIVYINQGIAPVHNILISSGYIIANAMVGVGTIYIGYCRDRKWRLIKNSIGALAIAILSVLFIWIVFFKKGTAVAELLTYESITSTAAVFLELFVVIELLILVISKIKNHISFRIRLIRIGILLFFTTNLVYYYCIYNGIYYSGSLADVLYIFSLALIAFGALWNTMANGSLIDRAAPDDSGGSLWAYFLVFPVIAVIAEGPNIPDLLIFAGIIALYHASVKYIQLASENERLLENEFSKNAELEKQISEQLRELTILANEDTVTNLYNRRYFTSILDEAIKSLRDGETLSVIQFDIDRFKTINDSYGHDIGDKVLIELSNRLTGWNKHGAVLARLGGDEFVLMLRGSLSRYRLGEYCKQIIELCGAPIYIEQLALYLTISTGLTTCPKDACDSITLMKNSDIAMYKAKAEGYNKYVFYNPVLMENIGRKHEIEALLRNADLETDFELVYQPQFTLPDKKLIGAEALLRWKSAEHGYIPPSIFVPIAEEIDYINRIGKWVLQKAVEQVIKWNTDYAHELKMGINVSPKQLSENDFFAALKTLITNEHLNTAWLDAEITENLMIEDMSKVKPIFDLFQELGISVSIDDFGSGYSSLGYLNKYHFDRIKIDKSLIDNLTAPDGSGVEIVKAIVVMSNAVGKMTIAEGVETPEQLEILRELGCQQVQGYLFGKPVPAEEFARKFLENE